MDKFVVDAGPFIHLDQIGRLNLLANLPFLLIPKAVILELKQMALRRQIRRWPHAHILTVSPQELSAIPIKKSSIDAGERECLAIAMRHAPCVFLTDDLAARNAADRLGIEVHGTVGLLIYGAKRRWITRYDAETALNDLYQRSSLFITYAIIEEAIHAVRTMRHPT